MSSAFFGCELLPKGEFSTGGFVSGCFGSLDQRSLKAARRIEAFVRSSMVVPFCEVFCNVTCCAFKASYSLVINRAMSPKNPRNSIQVPDVGEIKKYEVEVPGSTLLLLWDSQVLKTKFGFIVII